MQLFQTLRGRPTRLLVAAVMTVAWSGAVPYLASHAVAQPVGAGPARESAVDPAAVAALVKRLCATAEQELRKPGADPSDVPAKAAELGYDLNRAFAFVRNEVAFEPYRGMLRGPRGALAARAGNALDKALLLKGLLEAGGLDVRLKRGQLPADKAAALVEAFLKSDRAPATAGRAAGGEIQIQPALAEQVGIALPDLEAVLAENRRAADQFLADATASANVESEFLRKQLDAAGLKLGRTHEQWAAELAGRAADHFWLELVGADGATFVLDPTLGAAPGGPAQAASGARSAADLAPERHVVRFQLVYTSKQGGRASEQSLIDVPLYADESLYEQPLFSIEPADPLPAPSKMLEMKREDLAKLLTGFKNYQAVLRVGGTRTASPAFDVKGNVTPVGADGRVRGAQQVGAATGGLFGGALGGAAGGGGNEAQPNNFIELAVVLTLQSPGAAPEVQRRVLLTQPQTSGEEFISPILEWKMLVQPQPLTGQLVGYEALRGTMEALRPVLPVLDRLDAGDEVMNRVARAQPSAYSELLTSLAGFRRAAMEAALGEDASVAALWDRPQVSIAEQRICANAKEGRTCGHATIDLVSNTLSFVPRTPEAADAAVRCAVRQGVFDTVAEAMILARQPGGAVPAGAIDDLRAARQAGYGLTVVAPNDSAALASTSLSEADRGWVAKHEPPARRIAARLAAAGKSPAGAAGASAWWSVDPLTGCVLGRRDGGRGQSMSEYVVQIATGGICMIVNAVNAQRDISTSGGKKRKFGAGYYIAQLGCIIGAGFGVAGVGRAAGMQSLLTLINAGIGAALSILGAEVSRD